MPSKEPYEDKSLVQRAKREANQEEILAAALGMRMGTEKPTATFWQPLKIFAYSQLTSLVRRASLKESDLAPISEKVHNFKVRVRFRSKLQGGLRDLLKNVGFFSSCVAGGQASHA